MRKIWEVGFIFSSCPPYSPHLNIAETLWRMLKGQWIQPADYISTDTSSTLSIVEEAPLVLPMSSILTKEPDMFIYFSQSLM